MSEYERPPEARLTDEQRARLREDLMRRTDDTRLARRWLVPVAAAAAVGVLAAGAAVVGLTRDDDRTARTPAAGPETSASPSSTPSPAPTPSSTPDPSPSVTASPSRRCDREVAAQLPGAEVADQVVTGDTTTYLYATGKQWIVCDTWATVDGGPPTVLAPHAFSPTLGKDLFLISMNFSMDAGDGSQFFAAGARIPGVADISYRFPTGDAVDATTTEAMWVVQYLPAHPPRRIWTDPVVVTVTMDDGSTQQYDLTQMDLCAQVNHGC